MTDRKDPYEDAPHKRPGNAAMDRKHGTFTKKEAFRPDPTPTRSGIKRASVKDTETKSGKYGKWKIL